MDGKQCRGDIDFNLLIFFRYFDGMNDVRGKSGPGLWSLDPGTVKVFWLAQYFYSNCRKWIQ